MEWSRMDDQNWRLESYLVLCLSLRNLPLNCELRQYRGPPMCTAVTEVIIAGKAAQPIEAVVQDPCCPRSMRTVGVVAMKSLSSVLLRIWSHILVSLLRNTFITFGISVRYAKQIGHLVGNARLALRWDSIQVIRYAREPLKYFKITLVN